MSQPENRSIITRSERNTTHLQNNLEQFKVQYVQTTDGVCICLVNLWEEEGGPRLPYLSTKFLRLLMLILCHEAHNFFEPIQYLILKVVRRCQQSTP